MRDAWNKLWAFEEATTGKLISWKGLKVVAAMAIAGTVLDIATKKIQSAREADEEIHEVIPDAETPHETSEVEQEELSDVR